MTKCLYAMTCDENGLVFPTVYSHLDTMKILHHFYFVVMILLVDTQ